MVYVLLLVLSLWLPTAAQAATYYVSKSGSNANSCAAARSDNCPAGGSCAKLTMNSIGGSGGISCLAAGDTLLVQPGNYDEPLSDQTVAGATTRIPSGTSWSAPVTIKSDTLHGATLAVPTRPFPDWNAILVFWDTSTEAHHIAIEGFVLNGVPGRPTVPLGAGIVHGISLDNTQPLRFKDLQINWMSDQGILGTAANKEFLNVNVAHIGFDPDTHADVCTACNEVDCEGGTLCHAYYTDNSGADTNVLVNGGTLTDLQGHGLQWYSLASTIKNLTIHTVRGQGIWAINGTNTMWNNVIYNVEGIGIRTSYGGSNVVAHNTIWDATAGGIEYDGSHGANTSTFKNNLIFDVPDSTSRPYIFLAGGSGASGNALADGDPTDGGRVVGNVCDDPDQLGCATFSPTATYVTNPATGDASLPAGSPAINAGVSTDSAVNALNPARNGVTRPQDGQRDAGAYEAGPVSPATAVAFVQQPSNTATGLTITPPVTVRVVDAGGNTVTSSTASISLAFGANPGGASLLGTTTLTASAGLATFTDLRVSLPGTGYTLVASSAPLTGATSTPFNITGSPPLPQTYHVATTGVDPPTRSCEVGKAPGTPLKTIAGGMSCLIGGDTLQIHAGTYPELIRDIPAGSATQPTTIRAAAGEVVTITPQSGMDCLVWVQANRHYVTLQGLVLDGLGTILYGVCTDGTSTHNVTLDSLEVKNTTDVGLWLIGQFFTVRNTTVHDNGSGVGHHGIINETSDSVFTGNRISANANFGILNEGVFSGATPSRNTFTNNIINNQPGGALSLAQGNTHLVVHNTFTDSGDAVGTAALRCCGTNTQVKNNILSHNPHTGLLVTFGDIGAQIQNNVVFSNPDGHISGVVNATVSGTVTGDPLYTTATSDVHLSSASSPARLAGLALSGLPASAALDADGVARPSSGATDSGAYQYVGPVTPTPTDLTVITITTGAFGAQ